MKNKMIEEFKIYIKQNIEKFQCSNIVKEGMLYSMISDGKYIRPLLFLTLLKEEGIEYKKYFNVAMAIEMIHNYSLIHDDLPAMDNDEFRRGKLTVHKVYGEDIAILIGDGLLTNAFEVLCDNKYITDEVKVKLVVKFSKYSGIEGMIDGQVKDVINKIEKIEDLEEIHLKKTSRLIALSMESYCLLFNKSQISQYEKLGKLIGLYYQIQDDYLDLYGDAQKIGKTKGKDELQDKKTYTFFYTKRNLEKVLKIKEKEINELLPHNKVEFYNIISQIMGREK